MIDRKLLKTNRWEDEEYLHARMTNACFEGGGGGNGGGQSGPRGTGGGGIMGGYSDAVSAGLAQVEADMAEADGVVQRAQEAQAQRFKDSNALAAANRAAQERRAAEEQAQADRARAEELARDPPAAAQPAAAQPAAAQPAAAQPAAAQSIESFKDFSKQTGGGGFTALGVLDKAQIDARTAAAGLRPVNQEGTLNRLGSRVKGWVGMPLDVISQIDRFSEIIGPQHGVKKGEPNYGNVLHSDGSITSGQAGTEGKTIRGPTSDWNAPWYMNMPQWGQDGGREGGGGRDDPTIEGGTRPRPDQTGDVIGPTLIPTDPRYPGPGVGSPDRTFGPGWTGGPKVSYGPGLLNPTVPTFRGPAYQDWTRFMPTDFQLAEFGGMHYQPGRTGIPDGMGGGLLTGGTTGAPTPGAGTIWKDSYAGVPPVTYTPPSMETGVTTGDNVTTWPWGAGSEGAEGSSIFATMQHQFNPLTGKFEMMRVPGSGAARVPGKFLQGIFPYSAAIPTNMTEQEYNERLEGFSEPAADPSGEGWGEFDYGAVDATQADPASYGLGDWL